MKRRTVTISKKVRRYMHHAQHQAQFYTGVLPYAWRNDEGRGLSEKGDVQQVVYSFLAHYFLSLTQLIQKMAFPFRLSRLMTQTMCSGWYTWDVSFQGLNPSNFPSTDLHKTGLNMLLMVPWHEALTVGGGRHEAPRSAHDFFRPCNHARHWGL